MSYVATYLNRVIQKSKDGEATEHSYRAILENLFESSGKNISALNEPKRIECGAPDFILKHRDLIIGHCEAKDVKVDLDKFDKTNSAQKERYLNALDLTGILDRAK